MLTGPNIDKSDYRGKRPVDRAADADYSPAKDAWGGSGFRCVRSSTAFDPGAFRVGRSLVDGNLDRRQPGQSRVKGTDSGPQTSFCGRLHARATG